MVEFLSRSKMRQSNALWRLTWKRERTFVDFYGLEIYRRWCAIVDSRTNGVTESICRPDKNQMRKRRGQKGKFSWQHKHPVMYVAVTLKSMDATPFANIAGPLDDITVLYARRAAERRWFIRAESQRSSSAGTPRSSRNILSRDVTLREGARCSSTGGQDSKSAK